MSELSRETKQENNAVNGMNNFISACKTKELTDVSSSLGVEEFDVFLQDGRHEVSSQVAGDALTQNVENRGAHPYAKPRKLDKKEQVWSFRGPT